MIKKIFNFIKALLPDLCEADCCYIVIDVAACSDGDLDVVYQCNNCQDIKIDHYAKDSQFWGVFNLCLTK